MSDTAILIVISRYDAIFAKDVWNSNIKKIDVSCDIYFICEDDETITLLKDITKVNNSISIKFYTDAFLLNSIEMLMPGWCRQQLIKLKSYKIVPNENIVVIGGDVLLLRGIKVILEYIKFDEDKIIIPVRKHHFEDVHLKYEIERNKNVYELFSTPFEAGNNCINKDYIFDIFPFKRTYLLKLDSYITRKYGGLSYIFPSEINSLEDMKVIGEWSIYCIFTQLFYGERCMIKDFTNLTFQVHSDVYLEKLNCSYLSVHVVNKNYNLLNIVNEKTSDN